MYKTRSPGYLLPSFNRIQLETPNNYVTFKVRACAEAHVLLMSGLDMTNHTHYQVVIGGASNSLTSISKEPAGHSEAVSTVDILSCTAFR